MPRSPKIPRDTIVGLFLLSRLRYLTQEEVINMLNLDLLDTRAGQDLYRMGMTEGEARGEIKGQRTCAC
jgi:predicted transposase YdaD